MDECLVVFETLPVFNPLLKNALIGLVVGLSVFAFMKKALGINWDASFSKMMIGAGAGLGLVAFLFMQSFFPGMEIHQIDVCGDQLQLHDRKGSRTVAIDDVTGISCYRPGFMRRSRSNWRRQLAIGVSGERTTYSPVLSRQECNDVRIELDEQMRMATSAR